MIRKILRSTALATAIVASLAAPRAAAAQAGAQATSSPFDALIGTWQAAGNGFTSQLTYRWQLSGVMVQVSNELRGSEGQSLARYEGCYVRHPVSGEWRFLTAGGSGELHEGTAVWRDGKLWHDAVLHGGGIAGYSSVVVPGTDTMRYHANYAPGAPDDSLLELEPLVYLRQAGAADTGSTRDIPGML